MYIPSLEQTRTAYKDLIKNHQQKLVLLVGYLLVACLGIGLGRLSMESRPAPEIRVEQSFQAPSNYTANISGTQQTTPVSVSTSCDGKIKGTSSMIYHTPGDAYYNKTVHPTRCFETEAEAQAAGFKKSLK